MWPPTRARTRSRRSATPSRLCSGGLKSPNRSVNTAKARSIGASTTICLRTTAASAWVMTSPPSVVRRRPVAGQRPVPERVELVAQRGHAGRVEPIDPARARGALGDEPRVLEHLQVLGHRRPADRQLVGQLADRPRPLGQALDDGVACRCPIASHTSSARSLGTNHKYSLMNAEVSTDMPASGGRRRCLVDHERRVERACGLRVFRVRGRDVCHDARTSGARCVQVSDARSADVCSAGSSSADEALICRPVLGRLGGRESVANPPSWMSVARCAQRAGAGRCEHGILRSRAAGLCSTAHGVLRAPA